MVHAATHAENNIRLSSESIFQSFGQSAFMISAYKSQMAFMALDFGAHTSIINAELRIMMVEL